MGDTLKVSGNEASKQQFIQVSNKALGGFYKTQIDKKGNVSFMSTDKKGNMSKEQESFYNIVSTVLNQKESINIGLVQNDSRVIGGSYSLSTIDMADVAAFGDTKSISPASVLAHEIVEQNYKQKDGMDYEKAHSMAKTAEYMITGYVRVSESYNSKTSSIQFNYVNPSRYPKIGSHSEVNVTMKNNDFTKVEEKEK